MKIEAPEQRARVRSWYCEVFTTPNPISKEYAVY